MPLAGQAIATRITGDPETGNNGLFYFLVDHLGSTTLMVTTAGVIMSTAYFLPYGGYRYPSTPPPGELTDTGFTGHKHNDSVGLIFMNARYYVPAINRFLTADTLVPGPTNPQAYNRYTYVLGNPLRLVDPSGHGQCVADDCQNQSPPSVPVPSPTPSPSGKCFNTGDGENCLPTRPLATRLWIDPDKVTAVQLYGNTQFAYERGELEGYDYSQGFHGGIDIFAEVGTAVYAGIHGTVELINTNAYEPAYVVIRIDENTAIVIGHLDVSDDLKIGQEVYPDTVIGSVEDSEDHVHVEVLTDYPAPGGPMRSSTIVNPLNYMDSWTQGELFSTIDRTMLPDDYRINFHLRVDGQWQNPYLQPSLDYGGSSSLQE